MSFLNKLVRKPAETGESIHAGMGKLAVDGDWIAYKPVFGSKAQGFRVLRSQVDAVRVEGLSANQMGNGFLSLVGKGTELARVEIPNAQIEKAQTWVQERVGATASG
jgi:hypothetical protein